MNELLANYIGTFAAFCELINNSQQTEAENIWIDVDYTDPLEIHPLVIKKTIIGDDDLGVRINDLDNNFRYMDSE